MKTQSNKHQLIEVFIHIIAWALVFGFPLVFMNRDNGINWELFFRHSIVSLGYCVIFYINYLYLAPYFLLKDKIKSFLLINLFLSIVITFVVHFVWSIIAPPPPSDKPQFAPPGLLFFFSDVIMLLFVAGLGAAIRISMRWRLLEEQLVESEKQKTDAELKNLKNQLNPHFLLNTLNNIYALIAFDINKAQESVQELSKLLRYMLYDNQEDFVPLEKEFDFIQNYVELMKIRLPKHVIVQLNLEEEINSHIEIAPFIFISLIENAFKHGVSPTEDSFINISIKGKKNGDVVCEILNSNFPKSSNDKSGHGVGTEQVQKRLDLLYPKHYEWIHELNDKSIFHTILIIQTQKEKE